MVDIERVDRLLVRIAADLRQLDAYRAGGDGLVRDRTTLAAIKYFFITAIEGCTRIAHHLIASESWPVAESNAGAIRQLAVEGVVPKDVAERIGRAVGFRNVLVHEYTDVDDERVVENLELLVDLDTFVATVAAWVAAR